MKIAQAIDLSLFSQGGVEVLVNTLIHELRLEHEIFLVSPDPPDAVAKSAIAGMLAGHFQIETGLATQAGIQRLLDWARCHGIGLFHFHLGGTYGWNARSWHACPITELARAGFTCVSTNHQAVDFFDSSQFSRPAWRRLAATAARWPGKSRQLSSVQWEASVSLHDLSVSRRWYPNHHGKLVQLYHSRLDQARPVLFAAENHTILNVATLAFRKGQDMLIEAFSRIAADFPAWNIQLVGYESGDGCAETVRQLIRKYHLADRVELCGPQPEPESYFNRAGIYVQPSLLEGLGLSLQEAMFYGRACIGSNVGGIPELINDRSTGILCVPGDVTDLSHALSSLMGDPDKRHALGLAARRSILGRGMTAQAMISNYQTLYAKALSR